MLQGQSAVYEGRFGTYTITDADRAGVIVYRIALLCVALGFAGGTLAALLGASPVLVTIAYAFFCTALGAALATIHIYMLALHRALWLFWGTGVAASALIALTQPDTLALTAYTQPYALFGTGFVFAALTGVCIKESFCFGWWETAIVAFGLPALLLGHLFGVLPLIVEQTLLGICALTLVVFAIRKFFYPMPADIGDKTVHAYVRGENAGQT